MLSVESARQSHSVEDKGKAGLDASCSEASIIFLMLYSLYGEGHTQVKGCSRYTHGPSVLTRDTHSDREPMSSSSSE